MADAEVMYLIEHECAAVDSAQAGEALWQPAQAVDRVDVRAATVSLQRVRIQLNGLDLQVTTK